jgi:hypothetical protein
LGSSGTASVKVRQTDFDFSCFSGNIVSDEHRRTGRRDWALDP